MGSKFTELAIDCADPSGLARFWFGPRLTRCKTKTTKLSQLAPLWCRGQETPWPGAADVDLRARTRGLGYTC